MVSISFSEKNLGTKSCKILGRMLRIMVMITGGATLDRFVLQRDALRQAGASLITSFLGQAASLSKLT